MSMLSNVIKSINAFSVLFLDVRDLIVSSYKGDEDFSIAILEENSFPSFRNNSEVFQIFELTVGEDVFTLEIAYLINEQLLSFDVVALRDETDYRDIPELLVDVFIEVNRGRI